MGCCVTSSLEINLDDLRPYGFLPSMYQSWIHFTNILAMNRNSRQLQEIVTRLARERQSCRNNLRNARLDLEFVKQSSVDKQQKIRDIKRHEYNIKELNLLDAMTTAFMNHAKNSVLSANVLITVKSLSEMPMIHLDSKSSMRMLLNLTKRQELGAETTKLFQEILLSQDESVRELWEEIQQENPTCDVEADINACPPVPTDEPHESESGKVLSETHRRFPPVSTMAIPRT